MKIDTFASYSIPIIHDSDVPIEAEEPFRDRIFVGEKHFDWTTIKTNETNEIQLFIWSIIISHVVEQLGHEIKAKSIIKSQFLLSTSRSDINGSISETRSSTSLVVHWAGFQWIAIGTKRTKAMSFQFPNIPNWFT